MSRQAVGIGWTPLVLSKSPKHESGTCMAREHEDADSDDSADTVVASGELRSRWREQAHRLHPAPNTGAGMSDQRSGDGTRKAGFGAPVGAGRDIKKEFGASGDPPGPSGDQRSATTARLGGLVTAPQQEGVNGSNLQGRSALTPGRPIKTEQPAVVVVPPFNVKLENTPTASADREEVNSSIPADSMNTDRHESCVTPIARPTQNQLSSALSGSDSDFDESLSGDGSELDGFDDFLEGITRELNDGMFSDLGDEPAPKRPLLPQASKAVDQVAVKTEPGSLSRSGSTERLQLANSFDGARDGKRNDSPEASAVSPHPPLDDIPDNGGETASSDPASTVPATEVVAPQQGATDCGIDSESSQPKIAGKDISQLSTFVVATNEPSESTRHLTKYSGNDVPEKDCPHLPATRSPLEATSGLQVDDDRSEAVFAYSSIDGPLSNDGKHEELVIGARPTSNELLSDAGPGVSSSGVVSSGVVSPCNDEMSTARDAVELSQTLGTENGDAGEVDQETEQCDLGKRNSAELVSRCSSSLEPGELDTTSEDDIVNPQSGSSDAQTIVHNRGMIDQGIQVNGLEGKTEVARKDPSSSMTKNSVDGRDCKMIDTDTQTDPPRSPTAAPKTIVDLQLPSGLPKTIIGSADDRSAKHIDDYCEKTFWLLENFSEGLSNEDDSHKIRSALVSAKEARNGLNKRHGLPLFKQLNLCTNAVRSMLNALRRLSKRSHKKAPRREQEIETKEKPTEVVQPYTTLRDRPGCAPAESTRPSDTRPSDTRPSDIRPSETRHSDTRPSDTRPSETRHSDTRHSDSRHSETRHSDTRPSETRHSDTRPSETRHSDTRPSETRHSDTRASETRHSDTHPTETRHSDTHPTETRHSDTRPSETRPSETRPSETRPSEIRPSEIRPSVHDRPSYPHKSTARPSEGDPKSTGDSGTTSKSSHRRRSSPSRGVPPPSRSDREHARIQKHAPKPQERIEMSVRSVTLLEEPKKDSVWASRRLPNARKRIVEDGYGLSFLNALPTRQKVDVLFSTTFRRLGDKYRAVFENRKRLPETVRRRLPDSAKWQDIRSKRLKNELFTGFGIFLEDVTDLQDEFLPLNPFHINPLPPKEASVAGHADGNKAQGVPHEPHASMGMGRSPGRDMHSTGEVGRISGEVRGASGGAPRDTDVWEAQCQQFLEKIRPFCGTPTRAGAWQRDQSGQRVPSPAAFVDVHGGEVPNAVMCPPSFTSSILTDRPIPSSQVSYVSAASVPMFRCLIPVPTSTLDSTPTSSGSKAPVKRSLNPVESDMSVSEGEDKITGWTPPDTAGGSRVPPATRGDPTDESRPGRASRHASGRTSVTPPRSVSSGSRCPSSRSVASVGDRETDAQQIAHKIIQDGLDLLDQQPVTPSSSGTPASVKRRRRNSDEDSCEAKKRSRRHSSGASLSGTRPDRLFCEEHSIMHDDPWETYLHLSTRPDGSSSVACPLCDSIHAKTSILGHARSAHGIRKPSASDSDRSPKSSTPDTPPRHVTNTERSRRRSPSADGSRQHRTSKRARYDEQQRRRTGRRSSSRERSYRSSHHSSEDRWRRRLDRRSPLYERPRGDWPPARSRHRSASVESTCFPTPSRERHRSASVESTRFPERSVRRRSSGSPWEWLYDLPSPPICGESRWPIRSRRALHSPPERPRGYSPPERRSRRFHEGERDASRHHHHPGSDRSRRHPSGEDSRRRSSPDKGSRGRVKGESSRRRSRSPVDRSSREAAKRERLEPGEISTDSDITSRSSDDPSQERHPNESAVNPRTCSPSDLRKKLVTLRAGSSSDKKSEPSASITRSGFVSARQAMFEKMFLPSAAKIRSRLADIESDSNTCKGKSVPDKQNQAEYSKSIPQKKIPACPLRTPVGFSKEQLQRILTTVKVATGDGGTAGDTEAKPDSAELSTPKETCESSTPEEETHYISFVNDEQSSSDGERPTSPEEHADVGKHDAESVEINITSLNTEPVKKEGKASSSYPLETQPNTSQPQPDKQSHPAPATKHPGSKPDGHVSLPHAAEGGPKPAKSHQDGQVGSSKANNESPIETGQVGSSKANNESPIETVTLKQQKDILNVTASQPVSAVTASPKQDDRTSQRRSSGHQSSQQASERLKPSTNVAEIERQPEEVGKQEVRTVVTKRQTSKSKGETLDDQEANSASVDLKASELQSEREGKQVVESGIEEKQVKSKEEQASNSKEKLKDQTAEPSDACTENRQQDSGSKVTPDVPDVQQNVQGLIEAIQPELATSSVEEPGEAKIRTTHGEESDKEAGGSNESSKEGEGDEPSKEGNGGQPSKEVKRGEPSEEGKGGEPSKELKGGEPSKEGKGGEPRAEGKGGEPSAEGKGGEPSKEGKGGEPSKEGKGGEPSKEGKGCEPSKEGEGGESEPSGSTASPVKPGTITHRCSLCPVVLGTWFALRKHEEVCPKRVQKGYGGAPRQCPSCQRVVSNLKHHRTQCRAQCAVCGKYGLHSCFATHPARRPASRGQSPSGPRPFRPAGQRPEHSLLGAPPGISPGSPRGIFPGSPRGNRAIQDAGRWCQACQMWGHVCRQQGPHMSRGASRGPPGGRPQACAQCGSWGAHVCPGPGQWHPANQGGWNRGNF